MSPRVATFVVAAGVGFVLAWARLTDPEVIRKMLLLREAHVFFLMGSAVLVAGVGARVLRRLGARAFVTGERIAWSTDRVAPKHVIGSVLFGAGWAVAGTCPGPVAAMIGEGRLAGLAVAIGLGIGVTAQAAFSRAGNARPADEAASAAPGL